MGYNLRKFRKQNTEGEKNISSSSSYSLRNARDYSTIAEDEAKTRSTLANIYGGWQDAQTMADSRASVQNMYNTLNRYKSFKQTNDFDDVIGAYKNALDNWDSITEYYGKFKNADAYNAEAKKAQYYKDNPNLSYLDVRAKMSQTDENSDEYGYLKEYGMNAGFNSASDYDAMLGYLKDNGEKDLYDKTNAKKNQYELSNGFNEYKKYMQNSDFDAESQKEAPKTAFGRKNVTDLATIKNMTDEERAVGNYIYNTRGEDAYWNYMDDMAMSVGYRDFNADTENLQEWLQGHPGRETLYTIGSYLTNAASYIPVAVEQGRAFFTDEEYNPYMGASGIQNRLQSGRSAISADIASATDFELPIIGNVGAAIYDVTNSTIDSALGAFLYGHGFAPLMGTSAFNSTYKEAIENGLNPDNAVMTSVLSGLAETTFEYVSLEHWLKIKDAKNAKQFFINLIGQSIAEGSEEFNTEIANKLSDIWVNGNASDYARKADELKKYGYSDSEIKKMINSEYVKDILKAGIEGSLSGALMGGVQTALQTEMAREQGVNVDYEALKKTINDAEFGEELKSLEDKYPNRNGLNYYTELGTIYSKALEKTGQTLNEKETNEERSEAFKDYINLLKAQKSDAQIKAEKQTRKYTAEKTSYNGKEVALLGMTEDGKVKTSEGDVDIKDLDLSSKDATVVVMASDMSDKMKADAFVANYKGQNLTEYEVNFNLAFVDGRMEGKEGITVNQMLEDIDTSVIGPMEATKIFESGKASVNVASAKIDTVGEEIINKYRNVAKKGKFDVTAIEGMELTSTEKAILRIAEAFSVMGVNVRVIKDIKASSINGEFDRNNNEVVINLAARYSANGDIFDRRYVLPTMAHEFTHWMEKKAAPEFKQLQDLIFGFYGEKKTELLIAQEQKRFEEKHEGKLSRADAISEVMARACEDMLSDGKVLEDILSRASRSTLESLKAKVMEFFENMKAFLKDLMDGYASFSEAARYLRANQKVFEQAQKLWANAFDKALQNNVEKTSNEEDRNDSAHSDKVSSDVNESMTMDECADMIQRAFVLAGGSKSYPEYKNGIEWLKGEGIEEVVLTAENEYILQEKFFNKIPNLYEDFDVEDILRAYLDGTLVGKQKAKTQRIDVSKPGLKDSRFYAPKNIENYKEYYDLAQQKMTGANRNKVIEARAKVLMFAHNKGAAELLGITTAELNKKLRSWTNESASVREIYQRLNANTSVENQWSGIANMTWLNRATVSEAELDNLVRGIEGDSNNNQRAYIVRTMLALDTHIDYKELLFKFVDVPDAKSKYTNGFYTNKDRSITVKYNAPNTVAHEMGHYLDYKWGRDMGYQMPLTEACRRNMQKISGTEQWIENFAIFLDSIESSSDIHSEYTMDSKEVFARFVARFVEWTDNLANNSNFHERGFYNDKFTQAQFVEFARLLQEKSAIDGNADVLFNNKSEILEDWDNVDTLRSDKIFNKNVSEEMDTVFGKLSNGIKVSEDEIMYIPEVIEAYSKLPKGNSININTPERIRLRKEIADSYLQRGSWVSRDNNIDEFSKGSYSGAVRRESKVTFVIGLPASGKSSAAVNPISKFFGARVLDSDDIKAMLPEYDNGYGSGYVHEESKRILKDVADIAVSRHENVVIPIVGANLDKLENSIKDYKDNGYDAFLVLCNLDSPKAIGRALARFANEGRFIPINTLYEYQNRPEENYRTIIGGKDNGLEGYAEISTDVRYGEKPIFINGEGIHESVFGSRRQSRRGNASDAETEGQAEQYSDKVTDSDLLDFLNGQIERDEYVTTYKSMRLDDGQLHSPMAALINGKYENEYELGSWYQAVEHPELVKIDKKNGQPYFNLQKGKDEEGKDLGTVPARYNPYEHSSNYVINDQFKTAYKRDNLVTVEMRIPMSELTSGYKAQYAKDAVGWQEWKKGDVATELAKKGMERKVLLSRYAMPYRIVPNSEVAAKYKELLEGTDIKVPNNVVTPSLLSELKKIGVPIDENGISKFEGLYSDKVDSEGNALSEQQIEFFKDSKVRDENGRLKIMYHGTQSAGFTVFDRDFSDDGLSFFFTDDLKVARGYSGSYEMKLPKSIKTVEEFNEYANKLSEETYDYYTKYEFKIEKNGDKYDLFVIWKKNNGYELVERSRERFVVSSYDEAAQLLDTEYGNNDGQANYGVYLNLVNPFILDADNNQWDEIPFNNENATTRDIALYANNNGYDGIIIENLFDNGGMSNYQGSSTVVIAFNSNQIKSVANTNPTSDADIRYSDKVDSDVADLLGKTKKIEAENKRLKADVERLNKVLKLNRTVTKGMVLKDSQLDVVARVLLKDANSKMDKAELISGLKEVYGYILENSSTEGKEVNWDVLMGKAFEVARKLMAESKPEVIEDAYYKGILRDIRQSRVRLDEQQIAEAKNWYGERYRDAFMGKVILVKDGISLDSQWQEWATMYPDIFDADMNSVDMPGALLDIYDDVKEMSETLQYYNDYESIKAMAVEIYEKFWNVDTVNTMADKHKAEVLKLKADHRQAMTELKAKADEQTLADKMYYNKLLKKLRDKNEAEKAELKEYMKQKNAERKDAILRKAQIEKITDTALTLGKWLTANSVKEHIPTTLQAPVKALISAIDFSSKQLLGMRGGDNAFTPTKKDISISKALEKVRDVVTNAEKAQTDSGVAEGLDTYIDFPPQYAEDINKISQAVNEIERRIHKDNAYILNEMSLEDLKSLAEAVTVMKHCVTGLNKLISTTNAHSVDYFAQGTIQEASEHAQRNKEVSKLRRVGQGFLDFIDFQNGVPYYVTKRLGPSAHNMFKLLVNGQDKFAFNIKEVVDFAEGCYTTEEANKWLNEVNEFDILEVASDAEKAEGKENRERHITMTTAQIMSLYCLSKREQAKGHIFGGGIVINGYDTKFKHVAAQKGVTLTDSELEKILKVVTENPRVKEVADNLQLFMNTVCQTWGNEVSMKRFGIEAFTEENYFPIASDSNVTNAEPRDSMKSIYALLNMSFTKSLVKNANNRIVIDDIFNTFTIHAGDMAKYNAIALPVLDYVKWFNYKEKVERGDAFETITVKGTLDDAFGAEASKYIRHLLYDLNGQAEMGRGESTLKKFTKGYKIAAVGANLQVALLQPTSYLRATYVMDEKYLLKALTRKPSIAKCKEHCGLALWKSFGFYNTDVSRGLDAMIKHSDTIKDKLVEKSNFLAEKADEITWGTLWNACEAEIMDKNPSLAYNSEEFNKAVADRLTDVILATQVVDSTLTRSDLMRSTSMAVQAVTAFQSEPTLSLNMLNDARTEFTDELAKSKNLSKALSKSGKKIAKASEAYILASFLESCLRAGMSKLRNPSDDEDDEYIKLVISNVLQEINVARKIPIVKEVFEYLEGYSSTRMDMAAIESTVGIYKEFQKILTTDKEWSYKTTYKLITAISQASGLPLSNALREIAMVWNNTIGLMYPDLRLLK